MWFLLSVGLALFVCYCVVMFTAPQYRQAAYLIGAASQGVLAVNDFLIRMPLGAANAVVCGYLLWLWWNHGGSDGTRRRLRRLRARFRAVRRGAPVSARMVTR
jgi:hypothetical protein